MTNINWDLAPEGTVKKVKLESERWMNEDGELYSDGRWIMSADRSAWKTIATRPQPRKTVEDAAAKSEPEWTHEYRLGDSKCWFPCSIVAEVGTQGVVIKCDVFEGVQYCSYNGGQAIELKTIKPTITKAEAWDKLHSLERGGIGYAYITVIEKYEITD